MNNKSIFEMIEESQYLPELPEDISQIINILKDPIDIDIDMLIDRVSKSPKLNSLMLKNLNSGYFQLRREIKTVKEAIVYLGMQTVQNLLIFFMTIQLFPQAIKKINRRFDMDKYWKHVLGTSVASCMLATRLNMSDKYKLFSYGLIHDIGLIVVDTCLPTIMDEISDKVLNGAHQLVAERVVMDGLTHSDIGAWLCRKWNIREDITSIVEYHHTPLLAKDYIEEIHLIYVGDVISSYYYERLLGINQNKSINNRIVESLGLTTEDIRAVVTDFPQELEKVRSYITVN